MGTLMDGDRILKTVTIKEVKYAKWQKITINKQGEKGYRCMGCLIHVSKHKYPYCALCGRTMTGEESSDEEQNFERG